MGVVAPMTEPPFFIGPRPVTRPQRALPQHQRKAVLIEFEAALGIFGPGLTGRARRPAYRHPLFYSCSSVRPSKVPYFEDRGWGTAGPQQQLEREAVQGLAQGFLGH